MRTTEFKDTELGPIPKDWEVKRLGDVCDTSSGGTPPRSVLDFYNGTIKWFTTSELRDCYLCDSAEHISQSALEASSAKIFPSGTLLMAMYGATIGRLGMLTNEAATNQACCAIFCNDCDVEFLFYYLLHNRSRIITLGSGAGQPNISQQIVKDLQLSLPPLPEQRRIAAALGDVDKLIENLKKRVEKKKNLKRGAMQELLTGKRRLKGFTGAWVEKRFDEVFELHRNNTCARALMSEIKGDVHNLHYGDVLIKYGAVVDCGEEQIPFLTDAGAKVAPKDYLEDGDVVIADTAEDETAGKVVEVRGVGDRLVASGLHTIFCRPRFPFAIGWLGYWMNSNSYHDQLIALMTGIKVLSLSRSSFKQTKIMYPPLSEQRAIAAVLSDMDAEIANIEAKLKKMTLLKQGMMQDLLTGKVRLV